MPPEIDGVITGVTNTAEVVVSGYVVELQNLQGNRDQHLRNLMSQFMLNRHIRCDLVDVTYVCHLEPQGTDLATLILRNGAARAAPGAPQEYLDAQADAQRYRRGLWRARRH